MELHNMVFMKRPISRDKLNAIKTFYDNRQIDERDMLALIEHAEATLNYEGRLTFGQLQDEVAQWSRYNFAHNKDYYPLWGIVEEVGELHHARLKYEQGIRAMTHIEYIDAQDDAIGDILIYMADYCARNGLNLQYIIEKIWPQVRARDWKRFPNNGVSE